MSVKILRIYEKQASPGVPYSLLLESRHRADALMFESGVIALLGPSEVALIKPQYTKILDASACLGVLQINLGNNEQFWNFLSLVTSCRSLGKIDNSDICQITGVQFISLRGNPDDVRITTEYRNLLVKYGVFYYSIINPSPTSSGISSSVSQNLLDIHNVEGHETAPEALVAGMAPVAYDLTTNCQRQRLTNTQDDRFFWNRSMYLPLEQYGLNGDDWLVKMICGSVEMRTFYVSDKQGKACVLSRFSCERAGTRFTMRGVNDDGQVANFTESEQVIFFDNAICSFLQVRGSVPLFWEQPGVQVGQHKIKMSRGYESNAPAFDRHFATLKEIYGNLVVVNLLGSKEGEHMLSQAYQSQHKISVETSGTDDIPHVAFDYHAHVKGSNKLKHLDLLGHKSRKYLDGFGYFYADNEKVYQTQTGVMRINCVDCLDRTNSVKRYFGSYLLPKQIKSLGLTGQKSRFIDERFVDMWMRNGDAISKIYAGTAALGGGRKMAKDGYTNAVRTIQNNFLDSTKQESMTALIMGSAMNSVIADKARNILGMENILAPPSVLKKLVERQEDMTTSERIRIQIGTWNVNGGKYVRSVAHKDESLNDWLLDVASATAKTRPHLLDMTVDYNVPVGIYAIGFEEMVDLTASNIMAASQKNQKEWGIHLQKTLSRDRKYVLLTSGQLVGVCLYVFVRPQLVPFIRDVAVDSRKTGLGGTTGNKGAVAIRFTLHTTSMCFVCAHFAAGFFH